MTTGPFAWIRGAWRWLASHFGGRPSDTKGFSAAVSDDVLRALEAADLTGRRPPIDFFDAARFGFTRKVRDYLQRGADVNARDPRTQGTVLHHAASSGDMETLEEILRVPGLDTLVQDKLGRLAFDVAADPELGNRLLSVHTAQARDRGIRLNSLM